MRRWIIAVALMAFAQPSIAQVRQPPARREVLILGLGVASCAQWGENDRTDVGRISVDGWLTGYVSGANQFGRGSGTLGMSYKLSDMHAWMSNYCRTHAFDTISEAADAMIDEMEARGR